MHIINIHCNNKWWAWTSASQLEAFCVRSESFLPGLYIYPCLAWEHRRMRRASFPQCRLIQRVEQEKSALQQHSWQHITRMWIKENGDRLSVDSGSVQNIIDNRLICLMKPLLYFTAGRTQTLTAAASILWSFLLFNSAAYKKEFVCNLSQCWRLIRSKQFKPSH